MTALEQSDDDSDEYNDEATLELIRNLTLADTFHPIASSSSLPRYSAHIPPPPAPPSRAPPPYTAAPSSFPAPHPSPNNGPTYHFNSPTRRGHTHDWAVAGAATQGIPGASVRAISGLSPRRRNRAKKVAYVVFCGRRCGVLEDWLETKALVSGVSNCIYRGYTTLGAAHAAFAYARDRSWIRVADATVTPIPALPQPVTSTTSNTLSDSESSDDRWYIVYRGIFPGVYRSHLECQLNTLGVRRSLHESAVSEAAALEKYSRAVRQVDSDPFFE
ncbi:hypothetical protein C8R46DRAFT_1031645 [Mycena filopes]|nr:hypothetical protein C8R46DRAFT_1031645 [Mycena filopes]